MLKITFFILLSFFSQAVSAQFVEFAVKDKEGSNLRGAALSKYNVIAAVSDANGIIKIKDIGVVCRLHLTGYIDTSIVVRPEIKEVILKKSGQPLATFSVSYDSPLKTQMIIKDNSFMISPIDSTVQGDTVIEKLTKITVNQPSVLGTVMIPIVALGKINYEDREFLIYSEENNKPANQIKHPKVFAVHFQGLMIFDMFEKQIMLKPGAYYIGYKRRVGTFVYNEKYKKYYEETFIDKRANRGGQTFKRINNRDWVPVVMPKSNPQKPQYYSFAHIVQLVNTAN